VAGVGLVRAPPELVGGLALRAGEPAAVAIGATELARRVAPRRILADVVAVLTAGRPAGTRAAGLLALHVPGRAERARDAALARARASGTSAGSVLVGPDFDAVAAAALDVFEANVARLRAIGDGGRADAALAKARAAVRAVHAAVAGSAAAPARVDR